jgi:hypothetical protein
MKYDPETRKLMEPEPAPPRPGPGSPPKGGRAPDARGGGPPRDDRSGYLSELIGETVLIRLTSGDTLEGRLTGVRVYEILLDSTVVVMKAAIATVRRATPPP